MTAVEQNRILEDATGLREFFFEDLDAIHKARKICIKDLKTKVSYLNNLREIAGRRVEKNKIGIPLVSDFDLINAEPSEHLEALVKAIGKWKA